MNSEAAPLLYELTTQRVGAPIEATCQACRAFADWIVFGAALTVVGALFAAVMIFVNERHDQTEHREDLEKRQSGQVQPEETAMTALASSGHRQRDR